MLKKAFILHKNWFFFNIMSFLACSWLLLRLWDTQRLQFVFAPTPFFSYRLGHFFFSHICIYIYILGSPIFDLWWSSSSDFITISRSTRLHHLIIVVKASAEPISFWKNRIQRIVSQYATRSPNDPPQK